MRLLVLVLVLCTNYILAYSQENFNGIEERIVGGKDANLTYHPYQLSLQYKGRHICGASLIRGKWGVTAAHCTDGALMEHLSVRAGTVIRENGGQVVKVKKIFQHPHFDLSEVDYDISVLEFETSITHKDAKPVSLAGAITEIKEGSKAVITGWGTIKENGYVSTNLKYVEVLTVSKAQCIAAYGSSSITDRMFCAGLAAGGRDACQGDSGGPLVIDGVLTGIVSWGYGCARPKFPGVYSSIPALRDYVDYILSQEEDKFVYELLTATPYYNVNGNSERIIGGEDARISDHPYQLSLQYKGRHVCGASLIGDKWGVTAAHCTDGAPVKFLSVRAGTDIREKGGQVINVKKVYQHPRFNIDIVDYDVSVLEFDGTVTHEAAKPVPLALAGSEIEEGSEAVITGWGTTKENGYVSSHLKQVKVPTESRAKCVAAYGASAITPRMFCAGVEAGGRDACQGDSGGPLVIDGKLTGIVSWGYGCARPKYPGVYTSIPVLRVYIDYVTNQVQEDYTDKSFKVVGGKDAKITDYPYQLSLQYHGRHACGASLIGDKWGVTAAHCTSGYSVEFLSVRAGSDIRERGGQVVKVKTVYQHPSFDSSVIDYDISVLEFETSIAYDVAKPVSLAPAGAEIKEGYMAVITGWGGIEENGHASSHLKYTYVPIVSNRNCMAVYGPSAITDRMLCAGFRAGGKDACQGDSGGPLVIDGVLTGIVSWGFGCGRPKYPGVYASISALRDYVDFILNQGQNNLIINHAKDYPQNCFYGSIYDRIVVGKDATIVDYPYHLSLEYKGRHICGAALIGSQWGITAAHCTDARSVEFISVRAGTAIREEGGQVVKVKKIYQHPSYSAADLDYDISVLQFGSRIIHELAKPVRMASFDADLKERSIGVITGWGTIRENGYIFKHLKHVDIPIISMEKCEEAYGPSSITDRMFCAAFSDGGGDVCLGDSGGPLVIDGVLTGIASWGYTGDKPKYPGVYARIAVLREYIDSVILRHYQVSINT